MRLFLNYNSDMLQKKTERITLPSIQTTDELIQEIANKLLQHRFYLRFNIDGEFVRVIPGWYLSHYGIKHGSSLHLEFFKRGVQSQEEIQGDVRLFPVKPARKLSKIEEEMEEEQNIRARQDTALSKMSELSSHSNEDPGFDDDLYKLLKAAKEGQLEQVKKIIESDGRLINEFGQSGWALIHYAVFYDHQSIIQYLLGKNVDLNLITSDGWNPLQLAIKKRNIEIFQLLVKAKGIDINQVTQRGTALHHAVKMNLVRFVDILVDNNVDDSLRDDSGKTAVEICEDDTIKQSLIIPEKQELVEQEKQEQTNSSIKQGIYKGIIFRVRFLTYAVKQNYIVCDPFEGTLKRYESKDDYPKKPKEVIPLLQVTKVEMMKKKNMNMLMRSGYYYFQVYYPDRLMLGTKQKQLSIEWVKVIFQACLYVQRNQNKNISPSIVKHQTFELMDEQEKKKQRRKERQKEKEKNKTESGFKKEKQKQSADQQKLATPKFKTRESIFSQHMSETVILQKSQSIRMDMGKSLMTPQFHRSESQNYSEKYRLTNSQKIPFMKKGSMDQRSNDSPDTKRVSRFVEQDEIKETKDRSSSRSKSRGKNRSIISSQSSQPDKKQNFSTMAEDCKVGISSFEIIKEIGSGSFGKVFKAKLLRTKQIFALKAFKKSTLIAKKHLKYAVGEANILKKLSSPFIIQLHYAFQTPQYLYLCLDYCPNKDLSEYLAAQQDGVISQQEAKLIIGQVILAVEHMHSQSVIYRDMKPENVLIGNDGFIRMADFGLSRNDAKLCSSFCGSPAYLSPEMLRQKGVGKQSDIYGIGCILYEMLIGEPPYYHEDMQILYENIQKGNLKFTNRISSSAKELIQRLLERDPLKRITIQKIKQHSFFNGISFRALEQKQIGQLPLDSSDVEQEEEGNIQLVDNKKPVFIDADYSDDKKINKVSNFSFSKLSS